MKVIRIINGDEVALNEPLLDADNKVWRYLGVAGLPGVPHHRIKVVDENGDYDELYPRQLGVAVIVESELKNDGLV